jgi:hypothetical protein
MLDEVGQVVLGVEFDEADGKLDLLQVRGAFEGLADPFGHLGGLDLGGSRQDDGEFIAPVAIGRIHPADRFQDHLGHAPEDLIPFQVAVDVVEDLEVIQVEEEQAEGGVLPLDPFHFLVQLVVEMPLVVQSGQSVGDG